MRLVGREREIERLREVVQRERLVTLWGPPGVGKSRLAGEALRAPVCRLGAASEVAEVERAVANALGAGEGAAPPSVRALRALMRMEDPLVIDGADEAAGSLRELLPRWFAACEKARFVLTARAPLRLAGEHAIELEPLSADDAVALWLAAGRAFGHESDPRAAREIVERLDRLPLALEWFAPRAALAGDAACLEQLRRFDEGADPLSAVLEQSLAALEDGEHEALARIAMFEQGVPAAALEPLFGSDLGVVDRLARRSLLRIERIGAAPARIPAAPARITAYRGVIKRMRARARELGSWERLARLHAGVVLAFAPHERRDLDAVVERFFELDPPLALRACAASAPLALHDGTAELVAEKLSALLAEHALAEGLLALGTIERHLGRFASARAHLSRALEEGERFEALIELAHLDRMQSRSAAALTGYERALAQALAEGDQARIAVGLGEVGRMLQSMGLYREAQARHQQAIALCHSIGLQAREALERSLHARATHRAGAVREAIPLHRQALALHRRLGTRRLAGAELGHLAYCHHEIGASAEAEALYRESIEELAAVGDVALECIERTLLARLLFDEERLAEAKLELSIVERLARELDMPRIDLARRFVAGLVSLAEREMAGARALWRDALALGIHVEVGFEALLPAHLAFVERVLGDRDRAEELLSESEATVKALDAPGLSAALSVFEAFVRDRGSPDLASETLASSSEARRALRLVALAAPVEVLTVASDGRRLTLADGTHVELGRRAAPRRVLLALARARLERPGSALGFDELIAAGWPGERMRADAARKRLRTVVWTLRKLGLEPLLLTRDEGYLLDPYVPIAIREHSA